MLPQYGLGSNEVVINAWGVNRRGSHTLYGYRVFVESPANSDVLTQVSLGVPVDAFRAQANKEASDFEKLSERIGALSKGKISDSAAAMNLAEVEAGQIDLQRRMKALEDSLVATPEKALAVPLLREQLDGLQKQLAADELDSKDRSQRSADNIKWIFGLVAALITGIIVEWVASRFKHG
jgi:hypothetical protein